jgi:glycosyltransferase involved in cell wall biosynthesis
MPPKVSLIVPTFNQAQYLGACLDSLFFQDYPNLEIIVVNDCSTDNTKELLADFETSINEEQVSYASCFNQKSNEIERTKHFRYPQSGRELIIIHNDINLGSTKTYNRGFRLATGKYCTYIASDDICHPQMISEMVKVLEQGNFDFVYSDTFLINDSGRIIRQMTFPDYSFESCFLNWYLCGVSKLYRRELHEKFGYYNDDFLANDHELFQKFAMNGVRFFHIPKVLYSVRMHDRDREIGVHSKTNWTKLLNESRSLVIEARKFWDAGK